MAARLRLEFRGWSMKSRRTQLVRPRQLEPDSAGEAALKQRSQAAPGRESSIGKIFRNRIHIREIETTRSRLSASVSEATECPPAGHESASNSNPLENPHRVILFRFLAPIALAILPLAAEEAFTNPIAEGADPWVVRHEGKYIWCQATGNRSISLWISDRLTSLGSRHEVWRAPANGPCSKQIWAPEAHFLDGRWHLYVAGSDGKNENHLAYVASSEGADPLGSYTLHGPFATGEGADGRSPNVWAIDMTVLEIAGKRHAIWSGWDAPGTDRQFLYIAPMKSPTELAGPRVLLAANDDYLWERTEEQPDSRGLHEGPQVLQQDGRTFVLYSCGASWLPTYKLGMLELTGSKPLDPAAWKKHPEPVFRGTGQTFGVGHSCFVKSPDDAEWWHVYHAKRDLKAGWRRSIFVQPFHFDPGGIPDFGKPVAPGTSLPLPSGEHRPPARLPLETTLRGAKELPQFSYFGHQQFLSLEKDGVHLGVVPKHPVNDFRCGEKLVLNDADFTDIDARVQVRIVNGNRDAGLLFRVTKPSVGFEAQCGYFAGILPRDGSVVLGRTDGNRWTEIAKVSADLPKSGEVTLRVVAEGPKITVFVKDQRVIVAEDATWRSGSVGLRVVDTHAVFSELAVTAPRSP